MKWWLAGYDREKDDDNSTLRVRREYRKITMTYKCTYRTLWALKKRRDRNGSMWFWFDSRPSSVCRSHIRWSPRKGNPWDYNSQGNRIMDEVCSIIDRLFYFENVIYAIGKIWQSRCASRLLDSNIFLAILLVFAIFTTCIPTIEHHIDVEVLSCREYFRYFWSNLLPISETALE